MTEKELRRLSRLDLLQMLLSQSKEVSRLEEENELLQGRLEDAEATVERLKGRLDDKDKKIEHLIGRLDDKDVLISMLRRGDEMDSEQHRTELKQIAPSLDEIFQLAKEDCRRYFYALLLQRADEYGSEPNKEGSVDGVQAEQDET